jgi:gamma-glutamyltranspeptidase/glutathione hydrolase
MNEAMGRPGSARVRTRHTRHPIVFGTALVVALLAACAGSRRTVEPPGEVRGTGGAVATAEPDAVAAGLEILRQGGGAADAAVATALALAVVHPQAGNLGGGGFAVVRSNGEITSLDFRETAPAGATRDMFLDASGSPRPEASLVGALAAGVPGSPAGLFELHRRHGKLPWATVVGPAVRLARDGFTVTPRLHESIDAHRETLSRFPETAAVWLPGGAPVPAGDRLRLPDLAATLQAYADQGPGAIVAGRVAAAIEAIARAHGGILTVSDLAAYRPVWRAPLRFSAFGWEVAAMGLPSSGGILLAETLAILEHLGWEAGDPAGSQRAHVLAETWRRAYADRFLLGDPATTRAEARQLLDPAWLVERAATIDPLKATPSAEVLPWPGRRDLEQAATMHLSVADGRGDLVSLTTTLNGWFGCGVYVPGAGFFLNNEMDDFAVAPGQPNLFGLIQGEGNAVAPGARMLSSMNPVIAWRGGESIALGSPGGSRIPTATSQVLLGLIVDRAPLKTAVDRPRIHHQWLPDEIVAEPGALDADERADLERRGHRIVERLTLGEVHVVRRLPDGVVEAMADRRGPGAAGVAAPGN